jgi:hypothetical protein
VAQLCHCGAERWVYFADFACFLGIKEWHWFCFKELAFRAMAQWKAIWRNFYGEDIRH